MSEKGHCPLSSDLILCTTLWRTRICESPLEMCPSEFGELLHYYTVISQKTKKNSNERIACYGRSVVEQGWQQIDNFCTCVSFADLPQRHAVAAAAEAGQFVRSHKKKHLRIRRNQTVQVLGMKQNSRGPRTAVRIESLTLDLDVALRPRTPGLRTTHPC